MDRKQLTEILQVIFMTKSGDEKMESVLVSLLRILASLHKQLSFLFHMILDFCFLNYSVFCITFIQGNN